MTFILVGIGYALAVILFIALAVSASEAERLADRILGPGSSTDLELGLLAALDESQVPAERRR